MTNRGTESFRRVSEVVRRDVGSTTFLVDTRRNVIHKLNSVGAAVWELLVRPVSRGKLANTLHSAFPAVGRGVIERDLDDLLDELQDAELVAPSKPARPQQVLSCDASFGR